MIRWIPLLCLACASSLAAQVAQPQHPRLWLPASMEQTVRSRIAGDPLAEKLQLAAIEEADRILTQDTCRYNIPDGKRLLAESRRALHNIIHTAWAWRFTQRDVYRKRALAELNAACKLKDWNPSHFLDVAEMATAVSIGYDWLYPSLTDSERKMCEQALVQKALLPAKGLHQESAWWTGAKNNWTQVCGSGIGIACLALADREPDLTKELFPRSVKIVEACAHFYEPDGMYPEGPGYWHYGTNYHVMLIAACQSLQKPIRIPEMLEQTGVSMVHLVSPTQLPFNFADGSAKQNTCSPAQGWIANNYRNKLLAAAYRKSFLTWFEQKKPISKDSNLPLSLLWLPPDPGPMTPGDTVAFYHGEQPVAIFRTGWSADDTWLAIKGGSAKGGHSHMDIGSFCYDAHGSRWIHDLGSDNYNMPGYFGRDRFRYFRLQNRSHNTLEIDGKLQQVTGKPCPLVSGSKTESPSKATFNLSTAYADSAAKVTRSVQFDTATGNTVLTDDITEPKGPVAWRVVTDAECVIQETAVTLKKDGKSIRLRRIGGTGTWSVAKATPPQSIENPNNGFNILTLQVPKQNRISIQVEIRP